MNPARVYGAVALLLLLGVAVGGAMLHSLGNYAGVSGKSSGAVLDKQALLDGLSDGRILYLKMEDFHVDRDIPGTVDPPNLVLIEWWWRPEASQHGEEYLSTQRGPDGKLLQHTLVADGKMTITSASSGESMEMNPNRGPPTEPDVNRPLPQELVESAWEWPQRLASDPDFEFAGVGELNGRDTLIYGALWDSSKTRFEFVEDAPLLRRYSTYLVDAEGRETLFHDQTVIDYRLLPAGSSIPRFP